MNKKPGDLKRAGDSSEENSTDLAEPPALHVLWEQSQIMYPDRRKANKTIVNPEAPTFCALCDAPITASNDSREHVIPNGIGGRLKVRGFICTTCNSQCGQSWDAALVSQLSQFCVLLRIERERGTVPAHKFDTLEGRSVLLQPDGKILQAKPNVQKVQGDGVLTYNVTAGSHREVKTIVSDLSKKHPGINVDETLKRGVTNQPFDAMLTMTAKFGGVDAGRSLVKSALALAFRNGVPSKACEAALAYLKDQGAEACFGYYYERDLILQRPVNVAFHCVAISSKTPDHQLLGYVEIFGGAYRTVICLSDAYVGPDVHDVYAVDPVSGKTLEIQLELSLTRDDVAAAYDYGKIPPGSMERAFETALSLAVKTSRHSAEAKH